MTTCTVIPKCCVPFYVYSAEQAPPVVASATIDITATDDFFYQIEATNNPISFSATNLPSGVTVDPVTGIVSGAVASGPQTIVVDIYATNPGGTGEGTLTLQVAAPPVTYQFSFSDLPSFPLAGTLTLTIDGGTSELVTFDSGTGLSPTYAAASSIEYVVALTNGSSSDGNDSTVEFNLLSTLPALTTGSSIAWMGDITAGSGIELDAYLTTASSVVGPNNQAISGSFSGTANITGTVIQPNTATGVFNLSGSYTITGVSATFILKF